jgi:hypothetical protein
MHLFEVVLVLVWASIFIFAKGAFFAFVNLADMSPGALGLGIT